MNIALRHGNNSDNNTCSKIMELALASSKAGDIDRRLLTKPQTTFHFPTSGSLRLLASVDNKEVAFVDYLISKRHIKYLFVDPEYQNEGLGTKLLNSAQERMKGGVSVNVLCSNESAILWYLKRGFNVLHCWAENFDGKQTAWLKLSRKEITQQYRF